MTLGDQKIAGVVLSYLANTCNLVVSVILTPFLITSLGADVFGLYQLALAYAGYLVIFNFGMWLVIARHVAKCRATNESRKEQNGLAILFMGVVASAFLLIIIAFVGSLVAETVFASGLTEAELRGFQNLYWWTVASLCVGVFGQSFVGVMMGYEKFRAVYTFAVVRAGARLCLIFVLVERGLGPVGVVMADVIVSVLLTIVQGCYCVFSIRVRVILHHFDWPFARRSLSFGAALMVGVIATQVNVGAGKVILGSMSGTEAVAIYSVAITILVAFTSVTYSMRDIFMPQAVRIVHQRVEPEKLTDLVVGPGRWQFMLGGCVVGGFLLYGREFLLLWVGEEFVAAWLPSLLLLVPALILAIQNVTTSVLDAQMKRLVRSVVALSGAAVNVVLMILIVPYWGFLGAAATSFVTLMLSEVIVMNIYLSRSVRINVAAMYTGILRGSLVVLGIVTVSFVPVSLFAPLGAGWLLLKGFGYLLVCGLSLFYGAMDSREKGLVNRVLMGLIRRRRVGLRSGGCQKMPLE